MRGFLKQAAMVGATAVLVGLGAFSIADAGAAVRADRDGRAEIRFELDGSVLTAMIVDRPNVMQTPPTAKVLSGLRVNVVCGTTFRSEARARRFYVVRSVRWPRGALSLTVRFGRDISRQAKWCLIEDDEPEGGGDVAFVSFYDAEPGRRLDAGRLPDGTPWRLVAWRGEQLEPCLSLRRRNSASITCFSEMAETDSGIDAHVVVAQCSGATFLLGATTRSAVRVEARLADESAVEARLVPRPRGSRVRAQYFVALFDKPIDLVSVTAYDSAGNAVALQRRSDMSGPSCGPDGW